MNRPLRSALVLAACMCIAPAHAQDGGAPATDAPPGFRVTPALLSASSASDPNEKHGTPGLEYKYNKSFGPDIGASPDGIDVVLNAEGQAALNRKDNVGDLLDFNGSLRYRKMWLPTITGTQPTSWYGYTTGVLKGGLQTDQSFDTRHTVLSAELRTWLSFIDTPMALANAWPALILGYERVTPTDDKARAKADPALRQFWRAHGRLSSSVILGKLASDRTLKLMFEIEHWRETNPSAAISAAGLDRQTYRAIGVRLAASPDDDGWTLAYGSGNVPTDQAAAKVWKIGYSFITK